MKKKVIEPPKRKRGRPKGSKNKPKVATTVVPKRRGRPPRTDNKFFIGSASASSVGNYEFPIVQEETVKKPVAFVMVGAESFCEALIQAVDWAKEYSTGRSGRYWPLVKYKASQSGIPSEKRYVMKVGTYKAMAYAESRDVGSWLPVETLEVV